MDVGGQVLELDTLESVGNSAREACSAVDGPPLPHSSHISLLTPKGERSSTGQAPFPVQILDDLGTFPHLPCRPIRNVTFDLSRPRQLGTEALCTPMNIPIIASPPRILPRHSGASPSPSLWAGGLLRHPCTIAGIGSTTAILPRSQDGADRRTRLRGEAHSEPKTQILAPQAPARTGVRAAPLLSLG